MKTSKAEESNNSPGVPRILERSPQRNPSTSTKLIQKQLILLLHSHVCLRKDAVSQTLTECSVPNCVMMREVWGHIKVCQVGTECPHPHCLSSLRILAHWKTCTAPECCVCQLVRIKAAQQLSLRRSDQSEFPYGQSNAQSTFQSTQDYEKGRSTDMPTEGQNSQCQGQIQPGNVGSCISHCDMKSCGTRSQSSLDNAAVAVSVQANQEQCDDVKMKHGRCECHYASSAEAPSRSLSSLRPFQSPSSVYCRGTETNKSCRPLNFGSQQRQTRPRSLNLRSPSSFLPDQPQGPPVPQSCSHLRTRPSTITQDDRMPPFPSLEEVKEAYEAIGIPCPPEALERLLSTIPGRINLNLTCQGSSSSDREDDSTRTSFIPRESLSKPK